MKIIKLMPDYDCWALWAVEGMEPGNLDPADFPLQTETVERLYAWTDAFSNILDRDYPPDSEFKTSEDRSWFQKEGLALWEQVKKELAPEFQVYYYDIFSNGLYKTRKEYDSILKQLVVKLRAWLKGKVIRIFALFRYFDSSGN